MKPSFMVVVAGLVLVWLSTALAFAQVGGAGVAGSGTLVIKPLIEKKVTELPAGPVFLRGEGFGTLARAQGAGAPGHEASRGRQSGARPRRRDAEESLQQRLGGPPCAGHVRGRRSQAVLE